MTKNKLLVGLFGVLFVVAMAFAFAMPNAYAKNDNNQGNENGNGNNGHVPPGHLIAPGFLKHNGAPTVPSSQKLPRGIMMLLNLFTGGKPDTTAPKFFFITARDVTSSSANVFAFTTEKAEVSVAYGTTTSYGSTTTKTSDFKYVTTVPLSGLSANTMYHYDVTVTDSSGNSRTSGDYSFTTSATADTTPPVISAVAISGVTSSGATVTWTTDEASTSLVRYGTTTSYGSNVNNASLVASHSMALSGLSASTTYHVQVQSADASNNVSTSGDYTFTTLAVSEPVISGVTISSITSGGATVTWTTDESATSLVRYGTTTAYGNTVSDSTMVTSHSLALTGLSASTTYHVQVESRNASSNTSTSGDFNFATLAVNEPVISAVSVSAITSSGATVSFMTDENASSKVYYSPISPVNKTTAAQASDSSLLMTHSMILTGLAANTTYFYEVEATNASANTSTSAEFSFTTNP